MNKLKLFLALFVAISCSFVGCKKENQTDYDEDDVEVPTIIQSDEVVNEDGNVVVEVVFEDESRMYFILLDPTTAAVTNRESFYGEGDYYGNNYNGYVYRGDVVVPTEITHLGETYTVTTIGEKCFADAKLLKSVHIPHTVTSIEPEAFKESGIKEIKIPNSVKSLGQSVFANCYGLMSVDVSNSIRQIPEKAFLGCKRLSSISFPDSLEIIKSRAFQGCDSLSSVGFSEELIFIGGNAFENCRSLSSLVFHEKLETIDPAAFKSCNSIVSLTIPESVKAIGAEAFCDCKNLIEINYNAKDCYFSYFDNMGHSTWEGCSAVETINIGDKVEKIPSMAFSGLNTAVSVRISESVKIIGAGAFKGCSSLTSVTIPNSVRKIEGGLYYMFYSMNISMGAFENCTSLTSATIGNSVEEIGAYTFRNCQELENINIPNSVKVIGACAFKGCSSLESIIISNSVQQIQGGFETSSNTFGAFADCTNLSSVTIGNSVEEIGACAFWNCEKLENINIPSSVKTIRGGAFVNCHKLASVTIPESVESMEFVDTNDGRFYGAFTNCSGLTTVVCLATTPPIIGLEDLRFLDSPNVIYVPLQSVDAYKNDYGWGIYSDIIEGL